MAPGDVIAFHALIVHGAGGYTVRYCGNDAVYYTGPGVHHGLRNPELGDRAPLDSAQYPTVWRDGHPAS